MEQIVQNIIIAFITGLTTGGLSCLAVQGGLLMSSLSSQIEKSVQAISPRSRKSSKTPPSTKPELALPILVFLSSKVLAYTILGFLLGLLGQVFQLSVMARAILQIGIGIFMLGNALRMLNVHPIFRFFAIEPPAFLRRKIRKTANQTGNSSLFAPAWLGFLTVLIPCGVTQAMMAVALGTGNPVQGAVLMFAFTLGTSPVFFAVSYFATKLGEKLEKYFVRITAAIIIVLSFITINSGLVLAGSPFSLASVFASSQYAQAVDTPEPPPLGIPSAPNTLNPAYKSSNQVVDITASEMELITLTVENSGYYPNEVHVKADLPLQLKLVTDNVRSCSRAFVIPRLGVQEILGSTGSKTITIPGQKQGTKLYFSCSMGMYTGVIIFDA
jgi:sulfite exporter TauE/SafE